jgi:hypothetical protein
LEGESLPAVKTEACESVAEKSAGEVAGVSEEVSEASDPVLKLEQAEDEISPARPSSAERKTQPSITPSLPNSVPASGSPVKVSAVSSPSSAAHGPPVATPPAAASTVATPVGSPIPPDDTGIMVVEPYEPILSDEDLDETDAQVRYC